jgi:hypothetical protein
MRVRPRPGVNLDEPLGRRARGARRAPRRRRSVRRAHRHRGETQSPRCQRPHCGSPPLRRAKATSRKTLSNVPRTSRRPSASPPAAGEFHLPTSQSPSRALPGRRRIWEFDWRGVTKGSRVTRWGLPPSFRCLVCPGAGTPGHSRERCSSRGDGSGRAHLLGNVGRSSLPERARRAGRHGRAGSLLDGNDVAGLNGHEVGRPFEHSRMIPERWPLELRKPSTTRREDSTRCGITAAATGGRG